MEFFETYELSKILPPDVSWFRYVEDVLCLWPRDRPLEPFIEQLNGLVPSIKFTVKEEQNSSISFLDIKIHRHNNSFKFSVYWKPTNNLSYLHYYSHHASNVKYQCFNPCSFEHWEFVFLILSIKKLNLFTALPETISILNA